MQANILKLYKYFYPRSPCGERHTVNFAHDAQAIFLSTLSLRRATNEYPGTRRRDVISIHALLAESDRTMIIIICTAWKFLSTLSLRRATAVRVKVFGMLCPFLSTLSLRRATTDAINGCNPDLISIHALLAESDNALVCSAGLEH